ncbi:hypothetical protein HYH03_014157 [Edaphochlamys debaryana]|uniref:GH18 domain-containing protein n=1 Tax=Edaphochlamys debaryana TaxID=47281 RepID=A0A835XQL6_9CHLO|nr:hypothetical protein HYH03_014157 [Edaphochlamys debaryana]|eukprot:KAG2487178.1 hypothetical protein HYH03_014157 [Edaphochlamys debaryana]
MGPDPPPGAADPELLRIANLFSTQELQTTDAWLRNLTAVYDQGRAARCQQYKLGTMPQAVKDCFCDNSVPQLVCDARLKAALESFMATLPPDAFASSGLRRQLLDAETDSFTVSLSICLGIQGWLLDTLKFFGISICASLNLNLYFVKGQLVFSAALNVLYLKFSYRLETQMYDEAKDYMDSQYGICSPDSMYCADGATDLFCQDIRIDAGVTHVFYAFAKIDGSTYEVVDVEWNEKALQDGLKARKALAPNLKTLISVGGWSFSRGDEVFKGTGSEAIFPAMAASASNRAAFITSAIKYAKDRGFDGIDLDWDYDYHGAFDIADNIAMNAHTPVLDCSSDAAKIRGWYIAAALGAYIAKGAGAYLDKINMGLATYGRSFQVAPSVGLAAPGIATATGPGAQGECTLQPGVLSYYEIKRALAAGGVQRTNPTQMTAYALLNGGTTWVGYDTSETLRLKMCYGRDQGLSGVMVW